MNRKIIMTFITASLLSPLAGAVPFNEEYGNIDPHPQYDSSIFIGGGGAVATSPSFNSPECTTNCGDPTAAETESNEDADYFLCHQNSSSITHSRYNGTLVRMYEQADKLPNKSKFVYIKEVWPYGSSLGSRDKMVISSADGYVSTNGTSWGTAVTIYGNSNIYVYVPNATSGDRARLNFVWSRYVKGTRYNGGSRTDTASRSFEICVE